MTGEGGGGFTSMKSARSSASVALVWGISLRGATGGPRPFLRPLARALFVGFAGERGAELWISGVERQSRKVE